jgi:hypothetical protein
MEATAVSDKPSAVSPKTNNGQLARKAMKASGRRA